MTAVSVDSLVALGFVLGLRHATEADHLAAISTIVTERRSLLSSLAGRRLWGLGHTLALLVAGVGVLLLRYQLTDRMAHAFELCVGMMLVLLGANVLRTLAHQGATIVTLTRPSPRIRTLTRGSLRDRFSSGWSTGLPAARRYCSSR